MFLRVLDCNGEYSFWNIQSADWYIYLGWEWEELFVTCYRQCACDLEEGLMGNEMDKFEW